MGSGRARAGAAACVVRGNRGRNGAGVHAQPGRARVRWCVFEDNDGDGGVPPAAPVVGMGPYEL